MKILLCAATETEIAPALPFLLSLRTHRVEVVVTGVGMMGTAYALAKGIALHQPELVLQAGVAGSLRPDWPLGTVVAVRTETVGDLGVTETGFRSVFEMGLVHRDLAPWTNARLPNPHPLLPNLGLPLAEGVTVNEITTLPDRVAHYREHCGADIETMEGAALHYVGLSEKIPFLQLRALSNEIGERDKSQWQLKPAIANLSRELRRLLTQTLPA